MIQSNTVLANLVHNFAAVKVNSAIKQKFSPSISVAEVMKCLTSSYTCGCCPAGNCVVPACRNCIGSPDITKG